MKLTFSQTQESDPARYTPEWIRHGFADAGASHEPWIFQVRRNGENFKQWQKEYYDYQLSEPFIKSLADAGITVFHVGCYKGFGFRAEKDYMDKVAKAVAIAHKYGMKADTYIQWNTMAYETFFAEVPKAKAEIWYQIDEYGKPLMLTYGYQQSFRYRPCFNNDNYMNYFKEKIIRYVVEKVKADFIHFDNFDLNNPPAADFNPAAIKAFRKYLTDKYSPEQRLERFGFEDISYVLPPMWNKDNPAEGMVTIDDPVIQEWIDFRCWTMTSRLAECARFARGINKEIAIEVNPHGLVGSDRAWEAGINHPDLMRFTNVIWTEDDNNPRWEKGIAIGKFRHYKLGRTTNNFILTGNFKPQDFAENLALNRTPGFLGTEKPEGVAKLYLDFWVAHKDLYINADGAEKVAILRSYPSMAYNTRETQLAVNMAEQALQQKHIPFDIIFDQQLNNLEKYKALILAGQESLTDEVINIVKQFVRKGGGLVFTGNTGCFDGWRRLRKESLLLQLSTEAGLNPKPSFSDPVTLSYGKGRVIYLPDLIKPQSEVKLGFESTWMMPENAAELEASVYWAAGSRLPLKVTAPEWVGVAHDSQPGREVIHLFSYKESSNAGGIILEYKGMIRNAWAVSPDYPGKISISFNPEGDCTVIRLSNMKVYEVVVLER